jgi:uncharacterized delta-60 repeat protein
LSHAYYSVVKFTPNGSLDATFGTRGLATVPVGPVDAPSAIAVQADGKILVVGASYPNHAPPLSYHFSAIRLEANGSVDPSFGVIGKILFEIGSTSAANAVAVDGAGRIVLGGYIDADFAVLRLTPAGALDSTFGSGGVARAKLGKGGSIAALTIQPDGKPLVAGWNRGASSNEYRHGFARFQAQGALDPGFGMAGTVVTDIHVAPKIFDGHDVALGGGRATFGGLWWEMPGLSMGAVRHCL